MYVVTSWLLLQAADVIFPVLRAEEWAFPLLLGLLVLFFVPALIFSWVYEMTPSGLKLEKDVEHDSLEMISSGLKINKVVAVLLVIAISTVALDRLLPETAALDNGREGGADHILDSLAKSPSGTDGPPRPADRTIAVLSFINVSDGPGAESFGDSIAEQILNLLVHVDELRVTSRSSAFAFKDLKVSTQQIGQSLNVAYVLEGSVHFFDGQIRITAELIDTSSDQIVWSEVYDRPLVNVLVVQQEIGVEIVCAVKAVLLTSEPLAKVSCSK